MPTFIVFGPAACGKTTHATKIAELFNCGSIQDNWFLGMAIEENCLHLTQTELQPTQTLAEADTGELIEISIVAFSAIKGL